MARRGDTYGGTFIKATQSGNIEAGPSMPRDEDRMILTIKGRPETTEFDDGKKQRVISFVECEMRLGLNATNWDAIATMTGKDDDDLWGGTVIELFVIPESKSNTGHAIRVRKPKGAKPAAPAPAAKALGKPAADKLFAMLAEKGMELNDLRYALFNQECGGMVDAAPELWPAEWGSKIKAWLAAPSKAPEGGYKPINVDDLPF